MFVLNRLTCSLLSRPRESARMSSLGDVRVWRNRHTWIFSSILGFGAFRPFSAFPLPLDSCVYRGFCPNIHLVYLKDQTKQPALWPICRAPFFRFFRFLKRKHTPHRQTNSNSRTPRFLLFAMVLLFDKEREGIGGTSNGMKRREKQISIALFQRWRPTQTFAATPAGTIDAALRAAVETKSIPGVVAMARTKVAFSTTARLACPTSRPGEPCAKTIFSASLR